jgi:hypothetical protein
MKIEPPTHIEAETRCAHISKASKIGIVSIFYYYK